MEEQSNKKRVRDDSGELKLDSAEVKRLREDLLFILDEPYPDQETQEDLVSLMKSFEEEISAPPSPSPADAPAAVIDLTSETGESLPDLGYLLGATDDELGLPPSSSTTEGGDVGKEEAELVRVHSAESVGIGELLWGGEGVEFPNYDAFELACNETSPVYGHVAFDDGLFEYSNVVFDGSEFSDLSWRLGTMPAE